MLVLVLRNYNTLEVRSFKEWSSILDLSTRWGFVSIRELAIRCTKPPNSLNRLLLARKHGVEQWILPALLELCQRPEPLSLEEARLMDFEDVVLVGSVRQTVRSATLMVRGAEIRNCIRALKRGEPWSWPSDSGLLHPLDDRCQEPVCEEPATPKVPVWQEPICSEASDIPGKIPVPVSDYGARFGAACYDKPKTKRGSKGGGN